MLKRLRQFFQRKSAGAKEDRTASQPATAVASAGSARATVRVQHGPRVVHEPIRRADLDPDAVKIVERLTRFDHSAYLVGGCVRDLLLDHKPKDFDVATSATPRQIKRVFRNCRIIGRRFRLAHIYFQNGKIIEVATYRARDMEDGGNERGTETDLLIRDDNVFGTPEEDALRRDFTINALFYDVNNETVLDHAEGLADLKRRVVRTIGDPEIRFREDPIRILRAIKFAARLDFTIEPGTLDALGRMRGEIPKAAPPRILEEINRFCRGGAGRRSFELMRETGTFDVVFPELAADYRRDPSAWPVLLAALQRVDQAHANDASDVRTGEIFSALLAWPTLAGLGWTPQAAKVPARLEDALDSVERRLRPISLRLRVARRDQELCRAVLVNLARMVPAEGLRPAARRALIRRGGFVESLALLESLAEVHGGVYRQADSAWREDSKLEPTTRAVPAAVGPRAPAPAGEGAEGGRGRRRRRRGRRGGAGSTGATTGATTETPAAAPAATTQPLPSPWDDRYFFAALPTVPDLASGEDDQTDRYGASSVGPEGSRVVTEGSRPQRARPDLAREADDDEPDDAASLPEADPAGSVTGVEGDDRPRRSRRRRGRRGGRNRSRRPAGAGGEAEPAEAEGAREEALVSGGSDGEPDDDE